MSDFTSISSPFSSDLDMDISPPSEAPQIDRQQTPRPNLHQQQGPESVIRDLHFSAHRDQNTLCVGILAHLDILERDITHMRNFIYTGYKKLNDVGGGGDLIAKVEGVRLQARVWNKFHVTELEELFRILPLSSGEFPDGIPCAGSDLRVIDHKMVDKLLDLYDLPFIPTMFLLEKKIIYLHFLGANQVAMHRILD